jgi:hypothetical protein
MRILLLGGSGLLSSAARRAFAGGGHDVSVLTRGERPLPAGVSHLRADRRDPAALRAALEGARFDFTADFLAFGGGDVDRLLSVPGFSPGRLVAISSGQVYLVTASPEPPFREAAAERALMPEPAPGTRDHDEWKYGMGKRAMEARWHERRGSRRWRFGSRSSRARRIAWAPAGSGRGSSACSTVAPCCCPKGGRQVVRFVYAGDVAEALLALATFAAWPRASAEPRAAGRAAAARVPGPRGRAGRAHAEVRRRGSRQRSSARASRTRARPTGAAGARGRIPRARCQRSVCGRVPWTSTCRVSCARTSTHPARVASGLRAARRGDRARSLVGG